MHRKSHHYSYNQEATIYEARPLPTKAAGSDNDAESGSRKNMSKL